jgi:hypothetical protein
MAVVALRVQSNSSNGIIKQDTQQVMRAAFSRGDDAML